MLGRWKSAIILKNINQCCYSTRSKLKEYARCYQILEIPNGSDQETVRRAFVNLCKKYHPDSGSPYANADKFQELETAYRSLQNKFSQERWNVNEGIGEYGLYYKEKKTETSDVEPEIFDINHTAPQHRQYLSFDGVGSGTPSQRQKQYTKYRAAVAVENVYNHHINKISQQDTSAERSLIVKDKKEAKKIKTRYGIERLVEDLIQESMARGEFDNLSGSGKPLESSNYNPYVDFTTHKMNQIMIDNGFVPEWITLQKEIFDEIDLIREILYRERKKMGGLPLNDVEKQKWGTVMGLQKNLVDNLNKKINKFNLVVPILDKQMIFFNLERECDRVLEKGEFSEKHLETLEEPKDYPKDIRTNDSDFLHIFSSIFR